MRQVSNWRAQIAAVAGAWLMAAPGIALGDQAITPAGLQPYTARYQVSYRGLNGGEIESSFQHGTAAGLWQYETRVFPTLLARVAISSQAHERSVIQVNPAGIRPLSFNFNDGSNSSEKDVRLDFDWNALTVTGTFEGKPVSLPLTPGTHDTSSVQAAMIQELLTGRKPQGEYRYWPEGMQQVMTPYGQVEAEVWASQRTGSNRVTKTWHAESLGYVPVQAIQYRKGKPEVQMKLVKLTKG